MNKIFLFTAVLLVACNQSTESQQQLPYPNNTSAEQQIPAPTKVQNDDPGLFPDVSKKYAAAIATSSRKSWTSATVAGS